MIGDKIKSIREENKLSSVEFSKVLGINRSTLHNIENSLYAPSSKIKLSISKHFDFPILILSKEEVPKDDFIKKEQNVSVGAKIKKIREDHGYTQTELAEALDYASSGQICFIEKGKRGMSKDRLIKFCSLFQVSIEELMFDVKPLDPEVSKRVDLIGKFTKICYSKEQPELFMTIKNLINICADKLVTQ